MAQKAAFIANEQQAERDSFTTQQQRLAATRGAVSPANSNEQPKGQPWERSVMAEQDNKRTMVQDFEAATQETRADRQAAYVAEQMQSQQAEHNSPTVTQDFEAATQEARADRQAAYVAEQMQSEPAPVQEFEQVAPVASHEQSQ
ncbi:MAG: hypothetical protein JKY31_13300 [Rhodobacteraceae bacterium]|nr:hypothetical protein [Paracoccaceae bacterium]